LEKWEQFDGDEGQTLCSFTQNMTCVPNCGFASRRSRYVEKNNGCDGGGTGAGYVR
jgi:hypothetical protein